MQRNDNSFRLIVFYIFIVIFFNLKIGHSQKANIDVKGNLTINLKSRALVIGPVIRLGEICYIATSDSLKKAQIAAVKIGVAPPPGESTDISLTHIKRCLKKAGFEEFNNLLIGPKIIRITTAQNEIDKAFLKEDYAYNYYLIYLC